MEALKEFKIGKHNIGYVSDSFKERFEGVGFDAYSDNRCPPFQKLPRAMNDAAIESELKPGLCSLADVLAFLDNAPEECKDGSWNLFYTPSFVVRVRWHGGGWRVSTWERDGRGWDADYQVFSPAIVASSIPKKISVSDPQIEIWKSDNNREERHYFIKGGDKEYQHNTYLFGYNPELVSEETAKLILDLINVTSKK